MTVLLTALVLGIFIPIVQATTGTANEVRDRVLVDVYVANSASDSEVAELEQELGATPNVERVEFISKEEALAKEREQNPEAYDLLGRNPLPDLFRLYPDDPDQVAAIADHLNSQQLAAVDDVRNREDETDKILEATGFVKALTAMLAALLGPGVDRARGEHDPALDLRAPPRGRGDEARGRDELVHPLAVRDRRHDRRRDGRHPRCRCC